MLLQNRRIVKKNQTCDMIGIRQIYFYICISYIVCILGIKCNEKSTKKKQKIVRSLLYIFSKNISAGGGRRLLPPAWPRNRPCLHSLYSPTLVPRDVLDTELRISFVSASVRLIFMSSSTCRAFSFALSNPSQMILRKDKII